jgi:hypothetical protein
MATVPQVFDHQTPAAPTLTRGMTLGSTGVSAPGPRRIGAVVAGSGTGAFSANGFGFGQHAGDKDGYYYVADTGNNRVSQFDLNGNHVATRTATQLLGSNVAIHLLEVDLSINPSTGLPYNEIHIGSGETTSVNNQVSVWPLSLGFANLSTANWTRQYGSSNGAVASGVTTSTRALTLWGDYAVMASSSGARKVVVRNHRTGALVSELDWNGGAYRFAVANNKLWGGGVANTGASPGLREISSALVAGTRLDPAANFADGRWGVISIASSMLKVQDALGYGRWILLREHSTGRIVAWDVVTGLWADVFLRTDGEPSDTPATGGLGGTMNATGFGLIYGAKMGVLYGHNLAHSDYLFHYASNVGGASALSEQMFLLGVPLSTATATWTKTDWSAETNTLERIALAGANLADEKAKVTLQKNGGAPVTLRLSQLNDPTAVSAVGTFTAGDTLTVVLYLSTNERQDGHATYVFCRDRMPPTNVSLALYYDDPAASVFVPSGFGAGVGKLPAIVQCLYDVTEALTPTYVPSTPFQRYEGEDDLQLLDPGQYFRSFRIFVPSVVKGSLQDSRSKRSKMATVQIAINYPLKFQMDGDDSFLGIDVIRTTDGALIENIFCFHRPLILQSIGDVRSIKWRSSALAGRLWVITFEIEYLETIS